MGPGATTELTQFEDFNAETKIGHVQVFKPFPFDRSQETKIVITEGLDGGGERQTRLTVVGGKVTSTECSLGEQAVEPTLTLADVIGAMSESRRSMTEAQNKMVAEMGGLGGYAFPMMSPGSIQQERVQLHERVSLRPNPPER